MACPTYRGGSTTATWGTPEKPNSNPNPDSAGECGNSNWRGSVWIPVNGIVIRALVVYFFYDGTDFQIEFLTGSGNLLNLDEVAEQLGGRLASIFLPDAEGRRPVFGSPETFHTIPTGRIICCSMNTSMATTAPASVPATRPVGRA